MTLQAKNARVYGSDTDAIYLAPFGTALPTTPSTAPAASFEDIGWIHEDGITETATGSKTEIRGHQGAGVVRTRLETTGTEISFTALETKAQTNSLRYNQTSSSSTAGVRTVERSPGQKVSVRAAVIDFYDADDVTIKERWCIPRFEVTPDGDRSYVNNDIAGFPFIGQIIGSYTVYEFDETFTASSSSSSSS